jgi:hypothetical protein
VSGGFTVRSSVLASGSGQMKAMTGQCGSAAGTVTETLSGMRAAAGHPQVTAALAGAADAAGRAFLDAALLYGHVTEGLARSAHFYDSADL